VTGRRFIVPDKWYPGKKTSNTERDNKRSEEWMEMHKGYQQQEYATPVMNIADKRPDQNLLF